MGFAWFVVVLLAVELLPLLCINLIFVDVRNTTISSIAFDISQFLGCSTCGILSHLADHWCLVSKER